MESDAELFINKVNLVQAIGYTLDKVDNWYVCVDRPNKTIIASHINFKQMIEIAFVHVNTLIYYGLLHGTLSVEEAGKLFEFEPTTE